MPGGRSACECPCAPASVTSVTLWKFFTPRQLSSRVPERTCCAEVPPMKALVPLLATAALPSLAFAQEPGTAEPAPQTQTGNAPSEAQLSPPPDAEKILLPSGYVELANPA